MNILVLTPLYYIEGRPELFHDTSAVHYLVKYWAKAGHNVQVIVTYVNYRGQIKRYANSEQRKYWKNGYSYFVDGVSIYLIEEQLVFNKDWFTNLNNWHITKMIRNYLDKKKFSPDIIVNHFPCYAYGYLPMLGYDVPKIAVLHQTDLKKGNKDSKYRNLLCKEYQAIYSRSQQIYDVAKLWNLSNLQKEIIYSGAPMIEAPKNRKFKLSDSFNVLYVGKLIKRKNVDLLIRLLPIFDNMKLSIIGDGEEREPLKKLSRELHVEDRVAFLGLMARDEVYQYMRIADVFCMPSVRETFGLVYLEAMSQGCITVGTKHEGIDGIIKNGVNGFLCEATEENLKQLFTSILRYSHENLKKISDAAILTGNKFSEENVSMTYLQLIKRW